MKSPVPSWTRAGVTEMGSASRLTDAFITGYPTDANTKTNTISHR